MKKLFFIGLGLLVIFTSCATILSGTTANVTVTTTANEPVNITVDGQQTYYNVTGPTQVSVRRGYKKSTITAENSTQYGSVTVDKNFNSTFLFNIILGGIPGMAIDGLTGAATKPSNNAFTIYMRAKNNQPIVETVVAKEEPPKKDKPDNMVEELGTTDLAQTLIRWDVQSRPQGADLFWRVTSKTPDVKSTNDKYLQTTPYEATKTLDIKGLTYQNSGNVSIILKCEMDGYKSQEKVFNARMILDQEEISALFRLVKDE